MRFSPSGIAAAALALAFVAVGVFGAAPMPDTPMDRAAAIREFLDQASRGQVAGLSLDENSLRAFYGQRAYAPAWTGTLANKHDGQILLTALSHAVDDGLDPESYHVGDAERDTVVAAARYDVLLSNAAINYARDLRTGRPDLRSIDRDVDLPAQNFDPATALQSALAGDRLSSFLAELAPPQPQYAKLRDELKAYRTIASNGDWPRLKQLSAQQFQDDPAARDALGQRLAYEDTGVALVGSDDLTDAVKRFQSRHGLEPDGRVGAGTLRALNVPASGRAEEIAANMERWRWLPRAFEPTYVAVNVPDARLEVVDGGNVVLESRAIVGRKGGPTPILRAVAKSITINPAWNVPAAIARKEILPKLKAHSDYLASENMVLVNGPPDDPQGLGIDWRAYPKDVFPFRVQQLPGEKNALGRIKLELPNRFDVYLHDTPAQAAFELNERHLSHGCVRVEQIIGLASYALTGDVNSAAPQLEDAIDAGTTRHLPLAKPLPIYLLYWTAFVDGDGAMEFRADIYGRDERLIAATKKLTSRTRYTANVSQCFPA